MDFINEIKQITGLIRDIGLIIGIPFISIIFFKLYNQYILILKEKNEFLKETQFDRALQLIKSQKELYEIERSGLEQDINVLKSAIDIKENKIVELQNTRKLNEINESSILLRINQINEEEKKIEEKFQLITQLDKIYDFVFSDLGFMAEFKRLFFKDKFFSYYHYGGLSESVVFYREFAIKLENLKLATYENYEDGMESGVSIELNDFGIKLRTLLFDY